MLIILGWNGQIEEYTEKECVMRLTGVITLSKQVPDRLDCELVLANNSQTV